MFSYDHNNCFLFILGIPEVTWCNSTLTPLIVNSYSIKPSDIHANENLTLSIYATLSEVVTSGSITVEAKGMTKYVSRIRMLCISKQISRTDPCLRQVVGFMHGIEGRKQLSG